ncbi:MAG: putative PEP-binding protein [Betaproteobacteria bacterium]
MQGRQSRAATLYALGAIASWALLAALGVALQHVPPFLLTGAALVLGSVPTWPLVARRPHLWKIPLSTLALGVVGLFGFHFLLFLALRTAPPVQANLVNYLWPLFIVVLAPVLLPGMALRPIHIVAALLGFAGAAVAILGRSAQLDGAWSWGYLLALGSALIWAFYSLLTRRVRPFPTVAVGLFGLVSGLLSLLCHAVLEPAAALMLDLFLKYFDFLSIGTNDLIQYTLAIDRADESVAHLYDPLHPAVLRLVADTIAHCNARSKGVSICGEMAGDVTFTRLLLGLGLRSFSMHPSQILAVKHEILRADAGKLSAWAQAVLASDDPAATFAL